VSRRRKFFASSVDGGRPRAPARSLPAEQRTIPLSEIAARTKLGADGVEFLLMKTLSLKLIEGVIDQVDSTVQVRGCPPAVSSFLPAGSLC